MNLFSAALLVCRSPYTFCRRHEWRRLCVDYDGPTGRRAWPLVTIGWWTWDVMPTEAGTGVERIVGAVRDRPAQEQKEAP